MVKTVEEIMRKDMFFIREDQKIKDVLLLFVEKHISSVPVIGKNNTLTGIITDVDIIRQIREYRSAYDFVNFLVAIDAETMANTNITSLLGKPVKEVMTKDVITVEADTNIFRATKIFRKNKFKKIPVVKDDKLVGIITRRDIINYLVRTFLEKTEAES